MKEWQHRLDVWDIILYSSFCNCDKCANVIIFYIPWLYWWCVIMWRGVVFWVLHLFFYHSYFSTLNSKRNLYFLFFWYSINRILAHNLLCERLLSNSPNGVLFVVACTLNLTRRVPVSPYGYIGCCCCMTTVLGGGKRPLLFPRPLFFRFVFF